MSLEKLGLPSLSSLANLKNIAKGSHSPDDALSALSKTVSGNQLFYKWQDEHGTWQFTATPPPNQQYDTIETDPQANLIQSLSQSEIDDALGFGPASKNTTAPLETDVDSLGSGLSLTTVPITQVPKMLNDAKAVRDMLEQHTKSLEEL